jgi:hypothetical protein
MGACRFATVNGSAADLPAADSTLAATTQLVLGDHAHYRGRSAVLVDTEWLLTAATASAT